MAPPSLTPGAGAATAGTAITATTATPSATIHYTIDGGDPTPTDPAFATAAPVFVGAFTIKARAFTAGAEPSVVVEHTYTLTEDLNLGTIAAGQSHTVALRPDGTVTAWGYNGATRLLGVVYCSSQGVCADSAPRSLEGFSTAC